MVIPWYRFTYVYHISVAFSKSRKRYYVLKLNEKKVHV